MNKMMWGAVLFAAACTAGGEEPTTSEGRTGLGDEILDTSDGTVAALPGASAERPCGEHTVANIALPNGNRMAFCVLASGNGLVNEDGPMDRPVWHHPTTKAERTQCGLELYLAATSADVPVPAALVNACPPAHRTPTLAQRTIIEDTVFQPMAGETHDRRANYCNVSDSTFRSELCQTCAPYEDCIDWCVSDHWGWHDRWMSASSMLGEEGNEAFETNSSCNANTRVRQWEREDAGDAWGTPELDYQVASAHNATTGIIHHSVAIFGQDYDFRLRADTAAVSGAYHQHTGWFIDE